MRFRYRIGPVWALLIPVAASAASPWASAAAPLAAAAPWPPSASCDRAILAAEFAWRIPARLLAAIGEVESGRPDAAGRLRPWPWTIHAEGEGHFYATRPQAVAAAKAFLARGTRSIDVGCLQVNLWHHPNAFASLDQAFDPYRNARYAGRFLTELFAVSHSWTQATAAYHSQTPALAQPYQRRVMVRWRQPSGGPADRLAGASPFAAFAPAGSAYRSFAPPDAAFAAFAKARPSR